MKKLSTRKLSTQLSIIIIIVAFGSFLYSVISGYNTDITSSQENVLEKLHAITKTLSTEIDWKEHKFITDTFQKKDEIKTSKQVPIYNDLHELLKRVGKVNDLESDIYTLFLDKNKKLNFVVTSGETPYFRHSYSSAPALITEKFKEGASVGPYMDKHGTWLSAFAPIKNDDGETIAIVQADLMFDSFLMDARKKLYGNLIGSTLLFLIVTGMVLFYVKNLAQIDEAKSKALQKAFLEVESKNKDISDSINYAKRIQKALIPKQKEIKESLPNSFIMYEPKDVVSGDFPWFYQKEKFVYLAAVDCTGHGVPGAMLSIIGNLLLNDIVNNEGNPTPADLLNELHKAVVDTLKQHSEDGIADGMDVALCRIDTESNEVLYSGAHRPLYHWNTKEVVQYKGDKYPIGGVQYNEKNAFVDHSLKPNEGESIFFFSDGLQDQFNKEDRKFGPKRIRKIISENEDFSQLESIFSNAYFDWKGEIQQTDDILLMGIKF